MAVVTGAGSGIGRAVASVLAQRRAAVVLVDQDGAALEQAADELRRTGTQVDVRQVDVGQREEMEALATGVAGHHQRVDLLVNNAGVNVTANIADDRPDNAEWLMAVNFFGVLYGCRYFMPHLQDSRGWIVNVSSMAAFLGLPTQGLYSASKAAVKALSEALWIEGRSVGVGVTTVHPGAFRTGLLRAGRFADAGMQSTLTRLMGYARRPEHAARRIVQAVEREERRVVIGVEAHLLDWAARWAPATTMRLLGWLGARR